MSSAQGKHATGWVGWIVFAAAMMLLVGSFTIIEGIVAISSDKVFTTGDQGLVILDITAWGWYHLLYGILLVATGLALIQGAHWARLVAIAVVMVNAIGQMVFLPAYPFWSIVILTINFLVIWALIVHGDERLGS